MSVPDLNSSSKFEPILTVVKRAKTDNEKFAAMLIVSKAVKPAALPEARLRELLIGIGLQFPFRLLQTANSHNGDEETMLSYGIISASVISLFCMDLQLCVDWKLQNMVPHLLKTIDSFSDSTDKQGASVIVLDCIEALLFLVHHDLGGVDHESILKTVVGLKEPFREKVDSLIAAMVQKHPDMSLSLDYDAWLQNLSEEFKVCQGGHKFALCQILANNIQKIPNDKCAIMDRILPDIVEGLKDILCSKITANQRRPALLLVSELMSRFGLSRFIQLSTDSNFIVVVTRLACIEIGLFFHDLRGNKITLSTCKDALHVVIACFKIAENFCIAIAQFEQNEEGARVDILNFEQIRLTQPALADMANCLTDHIMHFLGLETKLSDDDELLLHSSIRLLGAWMNVENNLNSAQGVETLSVTEKILEYARTMEDLILLKTALPAIMLAADSSNAHNAVMNNGTLPVLVKISMDVLKCMPLFNSKNEHQEVLHLLLQTIIALCSVENFKLSVPHRESFNGLLNEIWVSLDACQNVDVTTEGYILCLATLIFNFSPELQQRCVELFKKCLTFAFGAYKVSAIESKVVLQERYEDSWLEISSLWYLTVRKMAECCQKAFAQDIFAECGWSGHVRQLVEAAKVSGSQDPELTSLLIDLSCCLFT